METIKRRNRLDLMTPAELAIFKAMQEVEKIGADERLTEAVTLLAQAKDLVADFIDKVEPEKPKLLTLEEGRKHTKDQTNIYGTDILRPETVETKDKIIAKQDELINWLSIRLNDLDSHESYNKLQSELSRLKSEGEETNNVFLIHRDGNTTRLYKNGVKISPEQFTKFYGCEMTEEQKKLLKIAEENYFNSLEQSIPNDYVKTDYTKPVLSVDKITDIIPAEKSDKLTADEILWEFEKVNNPFYPNSMKWQPDSLIKLIQFAHSQFVGEKVTDEMIEKAAKEFQPFTERSFDQGMYSGFIFGAQALRDGLIGK